MLYAVHPKNLLYRKHGQRNFFVVRAETASDALLFAGRMTDDDLPDDGRWIATPLRDDESFVPFLVETRAMPTPVGGYQSIGGAEVVLREG